MLLATTLGGSLEPPPLPPLGVLEAREQLVDHCDALEVDGEIRRLVDVDEAVVIPVDEGGKMQAVTLYPTAASFGPDASAERDPKPKID